MFIVSIKMAYYDLPDNRRYTPRPEHKGKPASEPAGDWFKELVHSEIKMTKLYEEEVVKRTDATSRAMKAEKKIEKLLEKLDIITAERNSLRDELGAKSNQLADLNLDFEESVEYAEKYEAETLSIKDKVKKDKKAVKQAKKAILEKDMLIAERDSLRDLLDLRTIERDKFHQALFKVRRRKLKIVD